MIASAKVRQTYTEAQQAAVLAQLDLLLKTPYFSHSRRLPAFLRYVVEHTLAGDTEDLKERTLGVEVFGKSPTYDTANDPIVRVTAAEVRKRIAQYYQSPEHQGELRLALPPGSYLPTFGFTIPENPVSTLAVVPAKEPRLEMRVVNAVETPEEIPGSGLSGSPAASVVATSAVAVSAVQPAEVPDAESERAGPWHLRRWLMAVLVAAVLVAMAGAAAYVRAVRLRHTAYARFWEPILGAGSAGDPVLFCIADQTQYTAIALRDANEPARQTTLKDNLTAVIIDDVTTTIKVAGVLQSAGRHYNVRGESATTLSDLRAGPAVIIGAFTNEWTLRLLRPLRFHFANNPEMTSFSIVDTMAAPPNRWTVDRARQIATNNYKDYGLVARFTDTTTGRPALIAAGIGRGGTIAAGELLSNPELLKGVHDKMMSSRTSPGDPFAGNIEIVLSTTIIDGEPGTPAVEAVYTW